MVDNIWTHFLITTGGEGGTTHTKQAEARNAAIHPTMHRTEPPLEII